MMFSRYLPSAARHTPERSGLLSAVRLNGAVRLGVPSGLRGVPGSAMSSHCAAAADAHSSRIPDAAARRIAADGIATRFRITTPPLGPPNTSAPPNPKILPLLRDDAHS